MKKLNKFFAVLVALAMMAMLSVTAFAANPATYDPDDAKLAKYLQAGKGVTKPDATYNFVVTPTNGGPTATKTSLTKAEMTADSNEDYYGFISITDMFAGKTWPSTGEYVYSVSEGAPTNYTEGSNPNDTLTTDDATYTLRVYIKSANGVNYIDGVTVQSGAPNTPASDSDEDKAAAKDADNAAKVDPTNPPEVADDGEDEQGNNVGFSFTNVYKNNLVTNDDDNNGVLNILKDVTGEYGDTAYEFSFDLAYTKPAANTEGKIRYRIDKMVDGTYTKGTATDYTGISPLHADLRDNEKLVIVAMPQGTTWNVTENLADATVQNLGSYVASSDKYMPDEAPTGGQNLITKVQTLSTADALKVTNAFNDNDVTPTGILVNNLPYIALALVAIGGLVAYVVVRRRQSDEA